MNPANSQQLMTGGWYLWRTLNQGDSWQRASAITPGQGSVSAIAVSPVDQNRAVVGMSDGYVLYNHALTAANHTTGWASSRPRTGYVSSVYWDPVDADVVYVTYATFNTAANQRHIYRSTDAERRGLAWTAAARLASRTCRCTRSSWIPPTLSGCTSAPTPGCSPLLIEARTGTNEVTGYANVVTEALGLNTVGDIRLYAFTHGRSAWRVSLNR